MIVEGPHVNQFSLCILTLTDTYTCTCTLYCTQGLETVIATPGVTVSTLLSTSGTPEAIHVYMYPRVFAPPAEL